MWSSHTVEYYAAMKRNKAPTLSHLDEHENMTLVKEAGHVVCDSGVPHLHCS